MPAAGRWRSFSPPDKPVTHPPSPMSWAACAFPVGEDGPAHAAGVLVWAASAAWTGWQAPGSRQMWISVLLLAVFTGLLVTAALFLRSLQAPGTGCPAHHTASRKTARPGHAHA